jgi:hypothetical protein
LLKKVVVFFPFPDKKGTLGQKLFEREKGLLADNTDEGLLVIREYAGPAIAVFKEWLYWEDVSDKIKA